MKALLIEVDFTTGVRAGGIQIKGNHNLMCHGWQNLDSKPGKEIRLVMDGDTKPYEGMKGVTILMMRRKSTQLLTPIFLLSML